MRAILVLAVACATVWAADPKAPTRNHTYVGITGRKLAFASQFQAKASQNLANAKPFPCNLKAYAKKPVIQLLGEIHHTPYYSETCAIAGECAGAGKYYLGEEGRFPEETVSDNRYLAVEGQLDPKVSRVFGVDDPFTYGLSLLHLLHSSWKGGTKYAPVESRDKFMFQFIREIRRNTFMSEAYKAVRKKYSYKTGRPAKALREISFLADIEEETEAQESFDGLASWHPLRWEKSNLMMQEIIEETLREYGKIADSEKYRVVKRVPKDILAIVEEAIEGNDSRLMTDVAIGWRNEFIAENIAVLYCRAIKEGKSVVIQMGAAHLPGLKALLEKMSGGTVTVVDTDAVEMFQDLESQIGTLEKTLSASPFGFSKARLVGEQLEMEVTLAPRVGNTAPGKKKIAVPWPPRLSPADIAKSKLPLGKEPK